MSSSPSPENLPAALETESRESVSGAQLSADALEAIAVDTPLLPPKEPLGVRLASYFGRHLLLLFVVSLGCLWGITSLPSPFNRPDFTPGQLAPRDYVAPQNTFLPDRSETSRRRAAAAALVPPAYKPASSAQSQALFLLREASRTSRRAAGNLRLTLPVKSGNLVVLPPEKQFEARAAWRPAPAILPTLRSLSASRWRTVEGVAESAVRAAYLRGRIRSDVPDDVSALRPLLRRSVFQNGAKEELSAAEREIALQLTILAVKIPNVVVNQKATDEAREDASDAVLPVFLRVESGAPLVREGERVSSEQWEQLQELGLIAPRFRPLQALANGAFCLLIVAGAAAYLARGQRDMLSRPAALWLMAAVPVLFLAVFRALMGVPHADLMIVPLAATAAMLLTVLIDLRVGLPAGFVVAALCALMARAEAGLFLVATLSAWIGALSVAQLASRLALLRSIGILTLCNAVLALALGVLREAPLEELLSGAMWSALAGTGSVMAMAGLAIFLERPFGITSHLRLLELLAPDETVIQRMQLEAPGTYTHSMTVAILAEAGAKSIGADPLLCRVAGLYHDIGKLRRPHCFIENQSGDNIHDRLSPQLSALLIKAHVKDGLELGRAVRLPQPVLEIIASHHGTGTIAYFLHRARQIAGENGAFDESVFRYPGPKPRSREAAIVLLADSVEASARSMPKITPERLENHVETIVSERLNEGELDECELSLKEMSLVREAFVAVLRGVYHGRIAYPDPAALSGELAASSRDWVRETLGEESPRNAPKVAAHAEKRQNKDRRRVQRPTSNQADGASGTQIESEAASADDSALHPARRRFPPPFHAPGPAPHNGSSSADDQTPKTPLAGNGSASRPAPDLEPRRAPTSEECGAPINGASTQENGANGHRRDASNGSAALSGSQKSAPLD